MYKAIVRTLLAYDSKAEERLMREE